MSTTEASSRDLEETIVSVGRKVSSIDDGLKVQPVAPGRFRGALNKEVFPGELFRIRPRLTQA